jgi:hypothetical protein
VERILGVRLDDDYDPADFWPAWIGHWFPSIGPQQMKNLTFSQIVQMYEFATGNGGG